MAFILQVVDSKIMQSLVLCQEYIKILAKSCMVDVNNLTWQCRISCALARSLSDDHRAETEIIAPYIGYRFVEGGSRCLLRVDPPNASARLGWHRQIGHGMDPNKHTACSLLCSVFGIKLIDMELDTENG